MNRKNFLKSLIALPMGTASLKSLAKMASHWESGDMMPALFVGHGNPMHAIQENEFTKGWQAMSRGLHPRAILCISAHWETRGTKVTMTDRPKTIHDFYGFPQALFDVQYPAPGAPEIGRDVINHVQRVSVEEDHEWGLDHGTWSVLNKMFPQANVPTLQLSLDKRMTPTEHYELGRQLLFLRSKGVLIVGSGNIIHNLGMAQWHAEQPYEWALAFDQISKQLLDAGDHQSLIAYDKLGEAARLSIPTAEHYLPMLYILGLQQKTDKLVHFQ